MIRIVLRFVRDFFRMDWCTCTEGFCNNCGQIKKKEGR